MSNETMRLPTAEARISLASRFNLPYHDDMQDWECEVADESRFQEFLSAYQLPELTDAERFSLMEVLIQCVEDKADKPDSAAAWQALESHLIRAKMLHLSTIQYWASDGETEPNHCFFVAPAMRRLLRHSVTPTGTAGSTST